MLNGLNKTQIEIIALPNKKFWKFKFMYFSILSLFFALTICVPKYYTVQSTLNQLANEKAKPHQKMFYYKTKFNQQYNKIQSSDPIYQLATLELEKQKILF